MINGLADRLKELRLKYNYSQKDVANKLGISPSIVSGYETGERTPSVDVLLSISYLYKCSTDFLLGRDKNNIDYRAIIDVSDLTPTQM